MNTPIIIPPEILSLSDTKLPEKLLLALCCDDPKRKPPSRFLSMTNAGLRKLEARLISKGLLSFQDGHHVVHIPGFVYSDRKSGGHFVSDSGAVKNVNKVASSPPTTTQATAKRPLSGLGRNHDQQAGQTVSRCKGTQTVKNLAPPATPLISKPTTKTPPLAGAVYNDAKSKGHFVADSGPAKTVNNLAQPESGPTRVNEIRPLAVPGELLDCKYLAASEKVLLAFYIVFPGAQNRQVIDSLGLSKSGLKLLKQVLIRKQVLVAGAGGFGIRLPGFVLVREAHGGHFVREDEAPEIGYKMPPAPRLTPPGDLMKLWTEQIKVILEHLGEYGPSYPVSFTATMIKRVELESPGGRERDRVLATMKQAENVHFVRNFIYENCPRKFEAKFYKLLQCATPAQIAAIREQAEGMTLAGIPEPKLLGMFTTTISDKPPRKKVL